MKYDFSVYSDINDEKWVKCDDYMSLFHLKCATSEPEHIVTNKGFVCNFFCLQKELSFININFTFYVSVSSFC